MEGESSSMSIDRVNISNQGIDRSQGTQQTESARPPGKDRTGSVGSDSAAISDKAAEMNRLAYALDQSRTDRLIQVRGELEAGTYRVSAKDLAKKLIDSNSE
jgi:flagellar biosynthesis anti-sigma factor FlgM